jgi:hypothetical protein
MPMVSNNDISVHQLREDVRKLIIELKGKWSITWSDWNDKVETIYNQSSFDYFEYKSNLDWGKLISSKTVGSSKSYDWWQDLMAITKQIESTNSSSSLIVSREESLYAILSKERLQIENRINYGCFIINQDTIIPTFFESLYHSRLPNLRFVTFRDWNEGLEAFAANRIDVALRDFPTTVAYNSLLNRDSISDSPLFFWPLFSFAGYVIVIKLSALRKYCKKNDINKLSFKALNSKQKTEFLQDLEYIVEKNTDFEWVLKTFCSNNGCDLKNIQIVYHPTTKGKREFIDNNGYSGYCTNPTHFVDLHKKKRYEFIVPQNEILNHKNFNGLICKKDYYQNNKHVIEKLINTWFEHIVPFKKEIKTMACPPNFRPEGYEPSHTVKSLIIELSKETQSSLVIDDLPLLYEHSNEFYDQPTKAFDEFYKRVLNNPAAIRSYSEIAKIQLNNEPNDFEHIKNVIASIKADMLNL